MTTDNPAKLLGGGLSLYANLLEPSESSSEIPGSSHPSVGERQQANEASVSRQQISAGSHQLYPM